MDYLLMAQQGAGTEGNAFSAFLPLILIVVIFYFFMIRPQMKRQKDLKKFRESLTKGDKVVTTGGIYGKVMDIKDKAILLQIDDNVKILVDKSAVVKDMTDVPAK